MVQYRDGGGATQVFLRIVSAFRFGCVFGTCRSGFGTQNEWFWGRLVSMPSKVATAFHFTAPVSTIDDATLILLPADASAQLPSRGQVAATASVAGRAVDTVIEPDGRRGHWIRVDDTLSKLLTDAATSKVGYTFEIEIATEWPEPDVPADLAAELAKAPTEIQAMWDDITPMARWEWVRWVQATANPTTRQRRVEVTISKMANGKRRPCCFDLSSCTDPEVARSGKLRAPN